MKLSPGQEGKVRILTASDLGKNGTNQSKFGQNDDSATEWSISLVNVGIWAFYFKNNQIPVFHVTTAMQ